MYQGSAEHPKPIVGNFVGYAEVADELAAKANVGVG
jgi:hypothetical protein